MLIPVGLVIMRLRLFQAKRTPTGGRVFAETLLIRWDGCAQ
jgi:hypothetical protein